MKVTIQKDGVSAIDESGNIYKVTGIEILKGEGKPPAFYTVKDHFYKVACPPNTYHQGVLLSDGIIKVR